MRREMEQLRLSLSSACLVLLVALPAAAQPADLELTCRPEFALPDDQRQRPDDVKGSWPFSTYYLFDNPQLFDYRVSIVNVSPQRRSIVNRGDDWALALEVRVRRDG